MTGFDSYPESEAGNEVAKFTKRKKHPLANCVKNLAVSRLKFDTNYLKTDKIECPENNFGQ